jgi:imidazolonepropionase
MAALCIENRLCEDVMRFDTIWLDARLATLSPDRGGLGVVERGAVAAAAGRIAFAGPLADLPTGWDATTRIAVDGRWITPGLIDCHTHLVYAGDRAHEFELRLAGASYEEIARAGGGIVSTVKATRAASEDDLVRASLPRLDRLLAEGVTTIEIKSGYGLERETEMRMLSAARRLARVRDVDVVTSFLGAHALPPEAGGDKERYIDEVCALIPTSPATSSPTPSTRSANPSRSRPSRPRACSSPRRLRDFESSCMPISFPTCMAPGSPPHTARCRPTISNTPTRMALRPWRARTPSPCCCPAHSTCYARSRCRRSRAFGATACRWRSPPTAIRARHRSRRSF